MINSYKAEGIVLSRRNFSESDKIITFFSYRYGKIKTLAKGVRKIKSRRAPHIELFNYARIYLHKGKNFDIITEAEILNSYDYLKKDLQKVAIAYYLTELVDKLCPERQEHDDIIKYLIQSFDMLNISTSENIDTIIDEFSRSLLTRLGFISREYKLEGKSLRFFIEDIIERQLKTADLLTKIGH